MRAQGLLSHRLFPRVRQGLSAELSILDVDIREADEEVLGQILRFVIIEPRTVKDHV